MAKTPSEPGIHTAECGLKCAPSNFATKPLPFPPPLIPPSLASCTATRPSSDADATRGSPAEADEKQTEPTLAEWKSDLQSGRRSSRWHSADTAIVLSLLPVTMRTPSPECDDDARTSIENMPPECSALPLWPSSLGEPVFTDADVRSQ